MTVLEYDELRELLAMLKRDHADRPIRLAIGRPSPVCLTVTVERQTLDRDGQQRPSHWHYMRHGSGKFVLHNTHPANPEQGQLL